MQRRILQPILMASCLFVPGLLQAQVVINEVMVKPGTSSTSAQFQSLKDCANLTYGSEYIELYNANSCQPADISCYILATPYNGISANTEGAFRFPPGTIIPPLGFISIGGANSGATILVPNFCSGPNAAYLQTAGARWYIDNLDSYLALYNASGTPVDVVFWTFNPNSANNWNTSVGGLNDAPSQVPNPGTCTSVSSLAGPATIPMGVVSYAGETPNMGLVIHRTTDGASTWATNATPTINNCNGNCNTAPTPTVTVTGVSTICSGSSATLSASGGNTYSWWNSGQTTSQIIVSPTASTTYTVTGSNASGCTDTGTITVTIGSIAATISGSTNICTGSSTTLTASGGSSYSWSTGATSTSVIVSPTTATTYSVIATSGSCVDTATVTINIGSITASIGGNTNICPGSNTTLTASGGSTYSWSTGSTSSFIIVSPTSATTYTVIATSGTCKDTATVTVSIGSITASVGGNTSICSGSSTTLTASGGNNYSWSTGSTSAFIIVSPAAATTYSVIATSGTCADTATVTVNISTVTASVGGNTSICPGSSATLTASGGTSYSWSNGATTASITVSPSTTTTYSVTATTGACSDAAAITVTVIPVPSVSISGITALCTGDNTTLTASGGISYSWSNGSSSSAITVSPASTSAYSVTATNANGCSATSTVTVTVFPPPVASATSATICSGQTAVLTASGGTNYLWSNGTTTSSVTAVSAGTYTVIVSTGSCSDTANASVAVNANPTAVAGNNVTITQGQSTTLTASGGTSYSWSSGDAGSPITVTPVSTTSYCVTVTNAAGCSDTACVTVYVEMLDCSGAGELFIPNAFSPNGDNENDELGLLYGNYDCIDTYLLRLYDRWGEQVFETVDPKAKWDGNFSGKKEGTLVFTYYLNATLKTGDVISRKGNISLIK